ncbi:MAG TPA: class I SAM-dependent methyltransferase [Vicinamibacteria bacterium]|nr:class I SAM-dependent methyltransferase [Vicinamibacteria bacterium]
MLVTAIENSPGGSPPSVARPVCALCGGCLDPYFTRGERHYERCGRCGFLVVPEGVATDASGTSIYESATSVFEADGNDGYYFDQQSSLANSRRKLSFVEDHLPHGSSLLDAGANFGHFLSVAQHPYRARGFDISPSAVAWSREHLGVDNVVASVYAPPEAGAPWDAISCWDVIEHLADPVVAIRRLSDRLRPGGWLFLSTPDSGSLLARALGRRWHYLDPVQHIGVFSRTNLRTLLQAAGFEVVTTRSLGHDYRVRYVLDRLCYLHPAGVVGGALRAARLLLRPAGGLSIYLQPGDVAVLSARRLR